MTEAYTITIRNRLSELTRVWETVDRFCQENQIFESDKQKMELALDEILGNIIHHAYPSDQTVHWIDLRFQLLDPEYWVVTIEDEGIPFDPTQAEPPAQRTWDLEQREPGGLGIYLVKTLIDQVSYQREGTTNVLKLTQHIRSLV